MRSWLIRILALGAMLAPALHTVTDAMEWVQGGFSSIQLWLNYLAFLPMPVVMLGLALVQAHRTRALMVGALVYGFAFVYFAHSTLFAITTSVSTYEDLWARLGATYTLHGMLMVVGGTMFGMAALNDGTFPRWTACLFLAGVLMNLLLAFLPVPDLLQTFGTTVRNAGLASMGWSLWRHPLR